MAEAKPKVGKKRSVSKRVLHNRFLKKIGREQDIKIVEHYVKAPKIPKAKKAEKKIEKLKEKKVKPVMDDAYFQKVLLKTRTPIQRRIKEKSAKKIVEKPEPTPYIKGKRLNATFHDLGNRGRLYAKGTFTGFKRGQRNQYERIALLNIEGCNTRKNADFYAGKKCIFMYRCKNGSKTATGRKTGVRVIWGKVRRPHGNRGAVRANFKSNLPPKAIGNRVRIMLYPSRI